MAGAELGQGRGGFYSYDFLENLAASDQMGRVVDGKMLYPPVHGLMYGVRLRNIKRPAERDAQMRTVA